MKRAFSMITLCAICMFLTLLFAIALHAAFGGDRNLYALTTAITGIVFSVAACMAADRSW